VRYLIVSDLHANLEALTAVLANSAGGYDRALCCGDLVGYGADPNPVCDWVRANCSVVVRGNHDRASTGQDDLEWFNPAGAFADPGAVVHGALLALFIYWGWDTCLAVNEETENPATTPGRGAVTTRRPARTLARCAARALRTTAPLLVRHQSTDPASGASPA